MPLANTEKKIIIISIKGKQKQLICELVCENSVLKYTNLE